MSTNNTFLWSMGENYPIIITKYTSLTIPLMWEENSYRIYPKYSDKHAWENSVALDQMQHSAASDLGLHC